MLSENYSITLSQRKLFETKMKPLINYRKILTKKLKKTFERKSLFCYFMNIFILKMFYTDLPCVSIFDQFICVAIYYCALFFLSEFVTFVQLLF